MAEIDGDKHAILARVMDVMSAAVPGAVCELQDYDFRIGCGMMDRWGQLKETVMLRKGLDEETLAHHAARLKLLVEKGGTGGG